MNISAADSIVAEYLIYRGFTQTYKALENEKNKDKTKQFEVERVVESVFGFLQSFDIQSFVGLWDFLNKRFYIHLDSDHMVLSSEIKANLLKYYLIHAFKSKAKDKIIEFFSYYSHEILVSNGIAQHLRSWFVLPYMETPQDDPEFAVYFTQKWADNLQLTLSNFLSIVLRTAPPPKLLLLERWFRSEAQQEIRAQLKLSFQKVDILVNRLEKSEERLCALREVVRDLTTYIQKSSFTNQHRSTAGLFEGNDDVEDQKQRSRELGQTVCRLANDCVIKSTQLQSMPQEARLKELVGKDVAAILFNKPNMEEIMEGNMNISNNHNSHWNGFHLEEVESNLTEHIQQWLKSISI